jgi:hypothetical protein
MKAGTENTTKTRIAIVLCVVAVITVAWTLIPTGARMPESASSTLAPREKSTATQPSESLDPRLRVDLLASSEEIKYEGKGKNIFSALPVQIEIPKVAKSPLLAKQGPKVYIPPPPPPITLKFFGTTNTRGEKPKAFLSQGEDVWIAHEGDVVNRHYKIVRISPNSVEVEDLLNNNRQNIPLTQG